MTRRPILTTFYSYKGGVGRTQALANVAVALANRGRDVVLVDMDLESPGLHVFFSPPDALDRPFRDADLTEREGLIDFLEVCARTPDTKPEVGPLLIPCGHSCQRNGRLRLLSAGRLDDDYPRRVAEFSWERFYENGSGYQFMELMRDELLHSGADFVLVDSRTGMTDVGSVCTFQLPEAVVILFALHEQGIAGARRVKEAIKQQMASQPESTRLERILLLPARVDEWGATSLLDQWIKRVRDILGDERPVELLADLDHRIPYLSQIAYGEQIIMDPGAEPNDLSRAYNHLADRLETLAIGTMDEPSPAANAVAYLQMLHSSRDAVERGVTKLAESVSAHDPRTGSLASVSSWAHRISSIQSLLREDLHRLEVTAHWLHGDAGHSAPDALEAPDTLPAWQELAATLSDYATNAESTWYRTKQRSLRTRLTQSAHGDQALIDDALQQIAPLLREGRLVDIEARLPDIEANLRQSSLDALLQQNRLDLQLFRQRLSDAASQRAWLDRHLHKFLEEGRADDESAKDLLWNLLRLRANLIVRLTRDDWAAYDILCLLVNSDRQRSIHCFEEIGILLWRDAWRNALEVSDTSPEWPTGSDSREQLRLVKQEKSDLFEPISKAIIDGLVKMWNAGHRERLVRLLRMPRNDPALDHAIGQIGQNADLIPDLRAGLLAIRLRDATPMPVDLARLFLQALVEKGQFAEAFYALCALQRIEVIDFSMDPDPLVSDIVTAYLVALLQSDDRAAIAHGTELLMDQVIIAKVGKSRSGQGLLAGLEGNLFESTQESGTTFAYSHDKHLFEMLPFEVRDWLDKRDNGSIFPLSTVVQAEKLINDIRNVASKGCYGGWAGSLYYNQAFEKFWNGKLETLLVDHRPVPEVAKEVERLDGQKWLHEAKGDIRKAHRRYGEPDGTAKRNLLENFETQRKHLIELNALRAQLKKTTLKMAVDALDLRNQARKALTSWLAAVDGEPGLATCKAVSRLLKIATYANQK